MVTIFSYVPLAAILVSMLASIPILALGNRPNLREGVTLTVAAVKVLLIVSLLPGVLAGNSYGLTLVQVVPGVSLALKVDAFGLIFGLIASFLWAWTSVYSIGYMRALNEHDQTRYFASFAVAIGATIGVAFAGNLLTLYLFYEVLSLSTYPLVTHEQTDEARASGRKYLTFILGTSIGLVLPAMLIVFSSTGSLEFVAGGILGGKVAPDLLAVLLCLFVFGFAKAAVMPFHGWLPAAMVAPTPVSSFLHGVAVVKAGVFSILRVVLFILGPGTLSDAGLGTPLAYVAGFTIITASLVALTQDSLKRRLAYSTIGQLSYMIIGVALLSPSGTLGGILHIAMHAFGKITLFLCAGAIYVASGKKYISQMNGLGRRMPITFAAFLLGAMSIIGLPPLGGFLSKWYLVIGTLESGQIGLMALLLISSLLNAAYFLPIIYRAWFAEPEEGAEEGIQEAPLLCLIPLCLTALGSFGLFLWPQPFLDLIQLLLPQLGMGG